MAEVLIKESTLSKIADAIREKSHFATTEYKPSEMASAIAAITDGESVSGNPVCVALIEGTINGKYVNNSITAIRHYAFYTNESLVSIDLPKVETIGEDAFYNCRNIEYVNIPSVKTIGSSAFRWNNIRIINMPNVEKISNGVFNSCNIESIDLPKLTYLGNFAFNSNPLKSANLPELTGINEGAFISCTELETINIPKVNDIGKEAFYGCRNLKEIYLPSVESGSKIEADAFEASGLTDIYVPFGEDLKYYAPWGATNATIHYNYTA